MRYSKVSIGLLESFLLERQVSTKRQGSDEVGRTAVRVLRRCLDNLDGIQDKDSDVIMRDEVLLDEKLNERLQ